MSDKTIKARIIQKHAVESDWLKATNFIPKQGEIIVYDVDNNFSYERFKIGDGNTAVRDLPFCAINTVYVGPDKPTDPNIKVWINTTEESVGEVVHVLPRITNITLSASAWTGSVAPYSQVVEIATVTSATKIELNPTVSQILSLQNDDIALMAENDGTGVVTIYSFGGKPAVDMIIQVILQEVSYI